IEPGGRLASVGPRASLRHLWTRFPSSLRSNCLLYSEVACRKAPAGCGAISQSHGGGGQNHPQRQGVCLQGHGKVLASLRQEGPRRGLQRGGESSGNQIANERRRVPVDLG